MRFSVLGKWPSAITSPGKEQGFVHTAACVSVRLAAPTLLSMKLSAARKPSPAAQSSGHRVELRVEVARPPPPECSFSGTKLSGDEVDSGKIQV